MSIKVIGEDKKETNAVKSLVERTNKANPKESDMRELREYLDAHPSLVVQIGNVGNAVFDSILQATADESAFRQEATKRFIEKMKAELGYHTSTFVEQMLIDEIAMRWLRLQVMENDHKSATYTEHTFNKGLYYDKRLHFAQARYLKAVETLVKVRKMIAATQAKGAKMFKNLMSEESSKSV
jgi:hypothetical protein